MLQLIGLAVTLVALSPGGDEHKPVRIMRTYPVGDLAVWRKGDDGKEFDPSILITMFETIESESWMSSGKGEGELTPFAKNETIVVAQTEEVHQGIAALLEKLRAKNRHVNAVESWKHSRGRITRVYGVSDLVVPWPLERKGTPDFDSLVELIEKTTDGGVWEGDCEINVDSDRYMLVVTHAPAVHDEIEQLMGQLRYGTEQYAKRIESGKCGHCGLGDAPELGKSCKQCRCVRQDPFAVQTSSK